MSRPPCARAGASLAVVACLWLTGTAVGAQAPASTSPTRQQILAQQREAKASRLTPEVPSTWEARLLRLQRENFPQNLFTPSDGIVPLIGGLPSGSGVVVGVGAVRGSASDRLRLAVSGRYSTTRSSALDASATFPTSASGLPIRVQLEAGYRDLRAIGFYGLGNASSVDDRTSFEYESRRVAAAVTVVPHRLIEATVRGGVLNGSLGSGVRRPSFDQRFDRHDVPGAVTQPEFFTYGGGLTLRLRDDDLRSAGVTVVAEAERYQGRDRGGSDFTRVTGEVQAHLPLGYRNRMLALRVRTSHAMADSGNTVPFYLMDTIGGSRTLRGFAEYRYRDARHVLMNLEYRWEVWNYADLVIFGDAGKVFAEADEFDLSNLQASYGVGIRTFFPGGGQLRFDLARSNEGLRLHIGGGPRF